MNGGTATPGCPGEQSRRAQLAWFRSSIFARKSGAGLRPEGGCPYAFA
jgi:hypothetical protein